MDDVCAHSTVRHDKVCGDVCTHAARQSVSRDSQVLHQQQQQQLGTRDPLIQTDCYYCLFRYGTLHLTRTLQLHLVWSRISVVLLGLLVLYIAGGEVLLNVTDLVQSSEEML